MTSEFTILIASDFEHEKVFAEIYFKKKFVAVVSQEEGLDFLKLEFPGIGLDEAIILRTVDLKSFQDALVCAGRRLKGETMNLTSQP